MPQSSTDHKSKDHVEDLQNRNIPGGTENDSDYSFLEGRSFKIHRISPDKLDSVLSKKRFVLS